MDFSSLLSPEKIVPTQQLPKELGNNIDIIDLDKPLKLDPPISAADTSKLDTPIRIPQSQLVPPETQISPAMEESSPAETDGTLARVADRPDSIISRYLPETGGEWSGDRGNSDWIPDNDTVPKSHNPDGKTWEEIKDEYELDAIPFEEGEPDFTEVSQATVEIDDFSVDRNANFTQADQACAEQWNEQNKDGKTWTAADVREYRKENKLSWHERSDQKTMDLVPSVVHGNVPHSGGISAAKKEAA